MFQCHLFRGVFTIDFIIQCRSSKNLKVTIGFFVNVHSTYETNQVSKAYITRERT